MEFIVFHSRQSSDQQRGLLRGVLSSPLLSGLLVERLAQFPSSFSRSHRCLVVPKDWSLSHPLPLSVLTVESGDDAALMDISRRRDIDSVLLHGRFITDIDRRWVARFIRGRSADVVFMQAAPEHIHYRERARITEDGRLVGFIRRYENSVESSAIPKDWPHQVWLRENLLRTFSASHVPVPLQFDRFLDLCHAMDAHIESFRVSAQVFDLDSSDGLIRMVLPSIGRLGCVSQADPSVVSSSARIIGPVLMGNRVRIGDHAVIVGPAILDDDVSVGQGALIHQSIIPQGQTIDPLRVVRNVVVDSSPPAQTQPNLPDSRVLFSPDALRLDRQPYRLWPWYSYHRTLKRAFDIFASLIILILFSPFFPIIALAVKLNSPGPVFYRARRQGLHGREFGCLKFRSMITTADSLQEKLRIINQVDGPQFKMENDPRVSTIGRFLRATNLDEIPQFINVLMGQMSIVGPRPSPDAENTLCPYWRYARLSVRPGITGLWQMMRTRVPARDFQEWVYYDTLYVRKISLKFDLWIAWKTAQKLILNFFDQF